MMRLVHKSMLALGLVGCLLGAQPVMAAAITGTLRDARTGAALAGVEVSLSAGGVVVLSGPDGRFVLPHDGGSARLRFQAAGFELHESTLDADADVVIELRRRTLRLHDNVHVVAEREPRASHESARTVTVASQADLEARFPRTTAEALMELSQVFVQKTNHGGGSPFLRGLAGNHVLLLVDGVRLNNSTYRYGPNQYLATVDALGLERIEVQRGVGSVLHGSDALGGVVSLSTQHPRFTSGGYALHGSLDGKLASADQEASARAAVELAGPRAAMRASFALRDYGDLRAGGALGVEAPSGYREHLADAQARVRLGTQGVLTVTFQNVHQDDVPRFDQVRQRGFSRWAFDPQARRLAYVQFGRSLVSSPFESLSISASWQRSDESRVRQQVGSGVRVDERDVVDTRGVSLELRTRRRSGLRLVTGGEFYDDGVRSRRVDTDTLSGETRARRGLYPDGAGALSAALFAELSHTAGRVTSTLGARYQYNRVRTPAQGVLPASQVAPQAVVGQASVDVALATGLRLHAFVGQGFRAPNLDDLSTLGPFDFGIEVPSPGLKPEEALGYELGARLRRARVHASVALFRSDLADLVDRVPSQYLGSPIYEGQRVFQRANVGRAYIQGAEAWLEFGLGERVSLLVTSAYTFGAIKGSGVPVRRIPPVHGDVVLRVQPGMRLDLLAELRYAGAQRRLAPGDLADHRIDPAGTPGFRVVNLRVSQRLSGNVRALAGFENVFDSAYRVHGSGIDGPGRQAWLAARLSF